MPANTTAYYERTAHSYDQRHGHEDNPEHARALEQSWPILGGLGIASAVDVGCGTGRALQWLAQRDGSLRLAGVDPSRRLLANAAAKLPAALFAVGTAERLPFADDSVDLVVATGIMHHVDRPARVIDELLRVARKAVLVSDHNNLAFGSTRARQLRSWLQASRLLGLATFVKHGFRRQGYTAEDGWWYPYSLLNDYARIARHSAAAYLLPTRPVNSEELHELSLAQSHLAVLALKVSPR